MLCSWLLCEAEEVIFRFENEEERNIPVRCRSRALALGPTSLLVTLESDRDLPVVTVNQQFDSE